MKNITLPQKLNAAVDSEVKDFAIKAKRIKPLRLSIVTILFGIVWMTFIGIIIFSFLGPLFAGKEVHFTSNGSLVVASPENLGPIMVPAIIFSLFVLIGIIILISGIYSIFKKGGYFVGTPTRLISYQNNNIRSINWEQFTGDVTIQKENITFKLKTGMKSMGGSTPPNKYVPDIIYITGIQDIFEIEKICRQRIQENSPTPKITK